MLRMMTGGGVLVAVLATSVPAQAQHRYRGDHYWHHRHAHRDGGGIDGGDVLLGAALIGGAVLVASAIDRGNGQRADDQERPVPPPHYYEPYGEPDPDAPSPEESERQEAVNRCGEAAEADASRYARIAQVGKVDAVDPGPRFDKHGAQRSFLDFSTSSPFSQFSIIRRKFVKILEEETHPGQLALFLVNFLRILSGSCKDINSRIPAILRRRL